jgi:hypothetical protein
MSNTIQAREEGDNNEGKIKSGQAGHQWQIPVILATQEVKIRRIVVQSQSRKEFTRLYLKKPITKKRAGAAAQGVGPEFKSQYTTAKTRSDSPLLKH